MLPYIFIRWLLPQFVRCVMCVRQHMIDIWAVVTVFKSSVSSRTVVSPMGARVRVLCHVYTRTCDRQFKGSATIQADISPEGDQPRAFLDGF